MIYKKHQVKEVKTTSSIKVYSIEEKKKTLKEIFPYDKGNKVSRKEAIANAFKFIDNE